MYKAYIGYNPCGCPPINYTPASMECWAKCKEDTGCIPTDAKCVTYNGEYLSILNVSPGENYEDILVKINDLIGTGGDIDYSDYNTACLSSFGQVATQSQFVETISNFVCTSRDNFNTFVNTTYANFVTNTTNAINQILLPGTTGCSSFVIPNGSTIQQIIQLIVNRICSINNFIDLSTVNWSNCITALSTPANIAQGFNEVIRQICLVQASIPSGTGDTYKVKLNASDTTEDFLENKLKGTSCININSVTGVDTIKRLEFSLGYTPEIYNFDPSYFSVTDISDPGCVREFNVSFTGTTGTVTSVGLTVPSIFTATGSPVTTAGNLGFTINNQAAGLVFAGPATGTATPTFRSLVTTDLSNQIVTYSKIQNVQPQRLLGNSTGSATSVMEITLGDGLQFDGNSIEVIKPLVNCATLDDVWISSGLGTGPLTGGSLIDVVNTTGVTVVGFTQSNITATQSNIQYKVNYIGDLEVRGSIRLQYTLPTPASRSKFCIVIGNLATSNCFNDLKDYVVHSDHRSIVDSQTLQLIDSYVTFRKGGELCIYVDTILFSGTSNNIDVILTLDGAVIPLRSGNA